MLSEHSCYIALKVENIISKLNFSYFSLIRDPVYVWDKGVAHVDLFLIRVAVTVESLERIFLYVISVSLSL